MKLLVAPLLLALGLVAPQASLLLFIFAAPFDQVAMLIGWDPRVYLAVALFVRTLLSRKTREVRIHAAVIAAWVLFIAINYFTIRQYLHDKEFIQQATSSLLYFAVGSMIFFSASILIGNDRSLLKKALISSCLSLMTVAGYGIYEAWGSYSVNDAASRIVSAVGNPNYLASYMSLGAVSFLSIARREKGANPKFFRFLLIASGLCASCAILTLSRIGIAAMISALILLWFARKPEVSIKKLAASMVMIAAIGVGLGIFIRQIRSSITSVADPELAKFSQTMEDWTRLEAAQYALSTIPDHPFFGMGLATMAAHNYEENGIYITTHDTLLEILAGTGIVGFCLLGYIARYFAKSLERKQVIFLLPAILCFSMNALFGDYLESIGVLIPLGLCYWYALFA